MTEYFERPGSFIQRIIIAAQAYFICCGCARFPCGETCKN